MELTRIYLNDHLAGSVGALALIARMRRRNDSESLRFLQTEIQQDQAKLRVLIIDLDGKENYFKQLGALVAERIGLLKTNGRLFKSSPLSPVIELETLVLGVTGKKSLWRNLKSLDPKLSPVLDELDQLEARADQQIARLVEMQHEAAEAVLGTRQQ